MLHSSQCINVAHKVRILNIDGVFDQATLFELRMLLIYKPATLHNSGYRHANSEYYPVRSIALSKLPFLARKLV